MKKGNIEYWKQQGIKILDKAPDNWVVVKNAQTAPNGYKWYSNGKSLFSGEREHCLVKED